MSASLSRSTALPPPARARSPSGSPSISGCPISIPACSTGRSAGGLQTGEVPAEVAARLGPGHLDDPALRGDEAGQQGSKVAAIPEVRTNLLKFQKEFASQRLVRTRWPRIGTVICPDAPVKLFVTAATEARAEGGIGSCGRGGGHYKTSAFLPRWRSGTVATANGRLHRLEPHPMPGFSIPATRMPTRPLRLLWRSSSARASAAGP